MKTLIKLLCSLLLCVVLSGCSEKHGFYPGAVQFNESLCEQHGGVRAYILDPPYRVYARCANGIYTKDLHEWEEINKVDASSVAWGRDSMEKLQQSNGWR